MKITFYRQWLITGVIILLSHFLNDLLDMWFISNIGRFIIGAIWLFHPVLPAHIEATQTNKMIFQILGGLLIISGIFSRWNFT